MDRYYELFSTNIRKFKKIGGTQYIGLCPFHDDTKESFSIEMVKGLWNCKACGCKGNAYQFAKEMGHQNPAVFINGDIYTQPVKINKSNNLNRSIRGIINYQ